MTAPALPVDRPASSLEQRLVRTFAWIAVLYGLPALLASWLWLDSASRGQHLAFCVLVGAGHISSLVLVHRHKTTAAFISLLSWSILSCSIAPFVMNAPPTTLFSFSGVVLSFSGLVPGRRPWRFPLWWGIPALVVAAAASALHPQVTGLELVYIVLLHDVLGLVLGLAIALVRHHLWQQSDDANAHLLASDRLASLGVIAAGLGHEINNPLAYIQMNLSNVLASDELHLQDRDALMDAAEGARRIEHVVKNLGFFARPEKDPLVVEVEPILRTTMELVHPQIKHQGRIELLAEPYLYIEDANGRLGQMALNLLTNAIFAIDRKPGGLVQIRTRAEGDSVVIDVDDNGPGIPPEVGNQVFDSFFTTKAVGEGTGLGLSICRHLAQSAGGAVSLSESTLGGACMTIVLPRRYPTAPVFRRSHSQEKVRPARVLIIDDDTRVATAMARVFRDAHTHVAASGAEGLRAMDEQSFDIVFCDAMMPGLSGLDVFQVIQAEHPAMVERFVFVTGGAYSGLSEHDLHDTGRPVLKKPAKPETLRQLVREAVSGPQPAAPGVETLLSPGSIVAH